MRVIAAVLALLAAVSAGGATIAPGDVAVAPGAYCCCITCPPDPPVYLLDNDGHLKQTLPPYIAVAFGPNGHLYAADRTKIDEYDSSLAIVRTIGPINVTIRLTVAQIGDIYALTNPGTLTIFSPSGAVKKTLTLPGANGYPTAIDLGPDQCTLFYIDNTLHGRRFNVCTEQPLAGLPPREWLALRTMSDGGDVAASDSDLSVFDANDHLLRTYSTSAQGGPWALAFDIDPGVLWWMVGNLGKLSLASGVRTVTGTGPAVGSTIAVNGEVRPSSAALTASDIPTLSTTILAALAIALVALAWHRLGR